MTNLCKLSRKRKTTNSLATHITKFLSVLDTTYFWIHGRGKGSIAKMDKADLQGEELDHRLLWPTSLSTLNKCVNNFVILNVYLDEQINDDKFISLLPFYFSRHRKGIWMHNFNNPTAFTDLMIHKMCYIADIQHFSMLQNSLATDSCLLCVFSIDFLYYTSWSYLKEFNILTSS